MDPTDSERSISLPLTVILLVSSVGVAWICYATLLQIPPQNVDFGMRLTGWCLLGEEAALFVAARCHVIDRPRVFDP
jgi:hypothetical protein